MLNIDKWPINAIRVLFFRFKTKYFDYLRETERTRRTNKKKLNIGYNRKNMCLFREKKYINKVIFFRPPVKRHLYILSLYVYLLQWYDISYITQLWRRRRRAHEKKSDLCNLRFRFLYMLLIIFSQRKKERAQRCFINNYKLLFLCCFERRKKRNIVINIFKAPSLTKSNITSFLAYFFLNISWFINN